MCTVKAQCKGILKMRGFMSINQVQLSILGNSPSHPTPPPLGFIHGKAWDEGYRESKHM